MTLAHPSETAGLVDLIGKPGHAGFVGHSRAPSTSAINVRGYFGHFPIPVQRVAPTGGRSSSEYSGVYFLENNGNILMPVVTMIFQSPLASSLSTIGTARKQPSFRSLRVEFPF